MRAIKIPLFWSTVVPAKRPARFHAASPAEPAYGWTGLDAELRLVRAAGLEPILYIAAAPTWATTRIAGAVRPDPQQYRAFALAAVRHYSGRVSGSPRVRYWQAWNEPTRSATGLPRWGRRAGIGQW